MLRHLLDRIRHPRSRADALCRLRARFAAQASRRAASQEQRLLAERLRHLREEMSQALMEVQGCAGCAKGHPLPAGRWSGGHCCSGRTLDVFTQAEVASLKLAGTRSRDLKAPAGDHAGCAFRGATGCSLPPQHRPNICARYICLELRAELKSRGDWPQIAKLSSGLCEGFNALTELLGQEGSEADARIHLPQAPRESPARPTFD